MSGRLEITLRERGPEGSWETVRHARFDRAVVLGRQRDNEEDLYAEVQTPGGPRLVLARGSEATISRRQLELRVVGADSIRVRNLSGKTTFVVDEALVLPCGESVIRKGLVRVRLGDREILARVLPDNDPVPDSSNAIESLEEATRPPGSFLSWLGLQNLEDPSSPSAPVPPRQVPPLPPVETPDQLLGRLQMAMDLIQTTAAAPDFFPNAARAVVEIVGLDEGMVLLREGDEWIVQAAHTAHPNLNLKPTSRPDRDSTVLPPLASVSEPRSRPGPEAEAEAESDPDLRLSIEPDPVPPPRASRRVLERLLSRKRTFYQTDSAGLSADSLSAKPVEQVVAAPILSQDREVVGALYGVRRCDPAHSDHPPRPPVTPLQAKFVELLAMGVAGALARLRLERDAAKAQVRFEQFFTPVLAAELARRPDLLETGRDAEISVMFCDIRGFTRESEHLGPAGTVEWIRDVMDTLGQVVLDHAGVLVDIIGDELIAMWGAPFEQPDHPAAACRAALDMLDKLAELDARWRPKLLRPMALGIGVNTGVARVGNIGTRQKLKYGPLGNTVNIASRVEGATKFLRAPLLVTDATRARLPDEFPPRRLGRFRLPNLDNPTALFEIARPGAPDRDALRRDYEAALLSYERRDFKDAVYRLNALMTRHRDDGPTMFLLARALECHNADPRDFDPVFRIDSK